MKDMRDEVDAAARRLTDEALVRKDMLDELARVRADRDRLQAIVDDWAGDGAEYRHALEHVVDCGDGCDQCRHLAQATLDRTTMGKLKGER